MNATTNRFKGSVKIVVCQNCGERSPVFEFDSEMDTDNIGLCSASRCGEKNLVVAELTYEEWKDLRAENLPFLPDRAIQGLANRDYNITRILRNEQPKLPPADLPFAEFRKQYKGPTAYYSCPCCESGEASLVEELTVPEFQARGGALLILGNISFDGEGQPAHP